MAKPENINRSRIRRDCASLLGVPVAGSPHRRPRSSSFETRRSRSEMCENGKQGGDPTDRPRNREASTLGERRWYARKVVGSF
jgi:hypothetical protein